jgi:tetratricopeptide (TPR) repeat protein
MAISDYGMAIDRRPAYVEAFKNRGQAKAKIGDFQGAIDDFSTVIRFHSEDLVVLLERARAKAALNNLAGAIEDLDAIISQEENVEAIFQRAHLKTKLKKYKEAINDLDTILKRDPKNAVAYNNRGIIKAMHGDINGAHEDFSQAATLKPDYDEALRNLQKVRKQLVK